MKFSEYCDTVEGTEEEQQFLDYLKQDEHDGFEEAAEKLKSVPVIGKVMGAVVALAYCESLDEFRQSKHYPVLMDWDIKFDPETKNFSLSPGEEQMKKVKKVFCIISAVFALLFLYRKIRRYRKKSKNK